MILCTDTPQFRNDIAEIIRVFFPEADVELAQSRGDEAEPFLLHRMEEREGAWVSVSAYYRGGESEVAAAYEFPVQGGAQTALEKKKYLKRAVKISAFRALRSAAPVFAPWGSLTGIRPTKLARELLAENTREQTFDLLTGMFDVEPQKAELALSIVDVQKPVLQSQSKFDMDVYIGIPFCRTRCSYCSFAAYELGRGCAKAAGVEDYLEGLGREITQGARVARGAGYRVRSLYIGGGTPTALTAGQLERVLETALDAFGSSGVEFTVEAGRPDTIDEEKLRLLKRLGVDRISINPQSMNAETLAKVGRSHSPEEIIGRFFMAREIGFDCINMDVIVGLPGETPAMVEHTLGEIEKLAPDNLTVHTLAIKRSSRLREELVQTALPSAQEADAMVGLGAGYAAAMGMVPYYMYRQKYMRGNLENVGYCLPGKASVYNIDIMEETTSILALGAGAISKWVYGGGSRIERAANPKDMATYLAKIEEMNRAREGLILAGAAEF